MGRRKDNCRYVPPKDGEPLNFGRGHGSGFDEEPPNRKPQGWWEPLEGIRAAVGVRPRGDIEG